MRALIVIVGFIGFSYAYVDMQSESTFASVLLPLFVVLGFIALADFGTVTRAVVD
jgi:hypothetical protein